MLDVGLRAHAHVDHNAIVDAGSVIEQIGNGGFQVVTVELTAGVGDAGNVHGTCPVDAGDADVVIAVGRSDSGHMRTMPVVMIVAWNVVSIDVIVHDRSVPREVARG